MFRINRLRALAALLVTGFVASHADAAACIYYQPWTQPSSSFASRVISCDDPQAFDQIALDDFVCEEGGALDAIRWWGVVLDPAQYFQARPYYIAIYADRDCKPGDLLYRTCVRPQVRLVGTDCRDQRVVQFTALVPTFQVDADRTYWLQISEDDAGSANVGVDDFRWSGHQPVRKCFAVTIDANGDLRCPIFDDCNQQESDLAFALRVQ